MPVIHVRLLPQPPGTDLAKVMGAVGKRVAAAVGVPENAVWTTWEIIPPGSYLEGDRPAAVQPKGTHPPLAELCLFTGRTPEKLEAAVTGVAEELVRGLGLEEGNAFVECREMGSGRVYTGGGLRR